MIIDAVRSQQFVGRTIEDIGDVAPGITGQPGVDEIDDPPMGGKKISWIG